MMYINRYKPYHTYHTDTILYDMLLQEIGEPTGTNAKSSCSFDGLEYHFPNRTGYG